MSRDERAARHPAGAGRAPLWAACVAVVLLGTLPYLGVRHNEFVLFDDPGYVSMNPLVAEGLTLDGVVEAFALEQRMANWHPLTWVSHMLDVSLFGLDPGPHHLMSVGLHALNALLLLLALRALTGDLWRPTLVAALFAAHPLRVESVAWVSERKDVLAGLAWMLCLLAYARWVRRTDGRPPWALIACFAAGLLCKPMVVTLPCVLLLLDVWPLRRLASTRPPAAPKRLRPAGAPSHERPAAAPVPGRPAQALLAEKLPLFLLVALSMLATILAQRAGAAIKPFDLFPLSSRLLNMPVAYLAYVTSSLFPSGLTFLYPHAGFVDAGFLGRAALATALLLLVSVGCWRLRGRQPWLLVGWLWFLGTLVPVIGLLQVGEQAHADRYTYLPTIGLGIMLAYGLGALVASRQGIRTPAVAGCLLAAGTLAALTPAQVATWRDSRTLYEHALAITEDNYVVHSLLGAMYVDQAEHERAIAELHAALAIQPKLPSALYNLGVSHMRRGEDALAAEQFRATLAFWPHMSGAHNNLGIVLAQQGQYEEAIQHLRQAIEADPANTEAIGNLRLVRTMLEERAGAAKPAADGAGGG